jgi:hypothetical protein
MVIMAIDPDAHTAATYLVVQMQQTSDTENYPRDSYKVSHNGRVGAGLKDQPDIF